MNTFERNLNRNTSCAQVTLIDAMIEWYMAKDEEDAKNQILKNPGCDLAGIKNSVVSGLNKAANLIGSNSELLISEEDLSILKSITAKQIISILDAIHLQWIEDNFSAKRWVEKFFKGQLTQYRKTSRISWQEVAKDLLFVRNYLIAGGCKISDEEIEKEFAIYVATDKNDDDIENIKLRALEFSDEIIFYINQFMGKCEESGKIELAKKAEKILYEHSNPIEIIEYMISTI